MTLKFTSKNGFKVHDLQELCSNDLNEAQAILESGKYTENISAEDAYRSRPDIAQQAVFEVEIDSDKDYKRFAVALEVGAIPVPRIPTFSEWMENKIIEDGRTYRLGKWMAKYGASQQVLDFYSSMVRTGSEKVFFTVSGMAQHVAGMTYYSDVFTSCMDTRTDEALSVHLAGALHDTDLYVGMLHEALEDVSDMDGRLLARVVFRRVEDAGRVHLIPTRYYGSVESKDKMHRALLKLQCMDIHSMDARWVRGEMLASQQHTLTASRDSLYELVRSESLHIQETIEKTVKVPCVLCKGSCIHKVYSGACDEVFNIQCPACDEGEIEAFVMVEIDEWREVEIKKIIRAYNDDYTDMTDYINIHVIAEYWQEHYQKFVIV